jgi:hypothetical protein
MKVVLDTNVLTSDHIFYRTEMIIFQSLCNERKIELLLPEIVLREFITQEQERANDAKKKILKELNNYCNTVYGSEKDTKIDIRNKIISNFEKTKEKIQIRKDSFLFETNAKILKSKPEDLSETLDRYFNGDIPFKKIKSRDDIPDCLIYLNIKDIKENELIFISDDSNLRKAIQSEGITVFSNLNDFVNTDKIKKLLEVKRIDDFLYAKLPQLLDNDGFIKLFHEALEQRLSYKTIKDERIPDDNNEGTITGIMGIYPTEFTKDEIVKHGGGLFSIPFYCEIDAYLDYFFYKADYCIFDEDRINDISVEDWNDHYYQAEEEYPLICNGKLGMRFNTKMKSEEIENKSQEQLIQDIKIGFSSIDIGVKEF